MNEKNSIAQSITKVKAVDRINQNSERSTAAPLIPFNPAPNPHAHANSELQGRLPQRPHIDISQYFAVVPNRQHPKPRFPVVDFLPGVPAPGTMLNTENEGSSFQMSSSVNTLTTGALKRKAPSTDPSTRKKRTCQKCGRSGCSGSNNRRFCRNPCQDCGQCSCPGRNSQHPTKDCKEGWKFHHKKLKL